MISMLHAHRRSRPARTLGLAALLVLLAWAAPASSLGDGDPASDFLIQQSTFLSPYDGHVPAAEATQLVHMLKVAASKGLSLKVAVIVTPYDLGSVPILFGKPQVYAKFLGEEDYYYWKNELVVVMSDGYGIYEATGAPAADVTTIEHLKPPASKAGSSLVVAAERAVEALAARRGIDLSAAAETSRATQPSSAGGGLPVAVLVPGVLVVVGLGLGTWFIMRRRSMPK